MNCCNFDENGKLRRINYSEEKTHQRTSGARYLISKEVNEKKKKNRN